jgi:excisionase family DNA binding protein
MTPTTAPINVAALATAGAPFSMDEAKAMLRCEEETVVARIDRGEIAAVKFGRSWIFPRGAFLQSLDTIALEEAAARRERQVRPTRSTPAAPAAAAGGRNTRPIRRAPPALPAVPQH